jgi:hypothetical protein
MKTLILSIILAFSLTHAQAQSVTCRPMPNGTTVCAPTPPPSSAGIGPALAVLAVLYLAVNYLKDRQAQEKEADIATSP